MHVIDKYDILHQNNAHLKYIPLDCVDRLWVLMSRWWIWLMISPDEAYHQGIFKWDWIFWVI